MNVEIFYDVRFFSPANIVEQGYEDPLPHKVELIILL
jgi:hypothetical protein